MKKKNIRRKKYYQIFSMNMNRVILATLAVFLTACVVSKVPPTRENNYGYGQNYFWDYDSTYWGYYLIKISKKETMRTQLVELTVDQKYEVLGYLHKLYPKAKLIEPYEFEDYDLFANKNKFPTSKEYAEDELSRTLWFDDINNIHDTKIDFEYLLNN